MPFRIVRNDITQMTVDAIVNAANADLQMGSGVCGAVYSAAGAQKLQKECDTIGYCPTGNAVITKGFDLKAKYIIHAVGPVWEGGSADEKQLLGQAYTSSLHLAAEHDCESMAFPLISTGVYGYPKDLALDVAIDAISGFLDEHEMMVYLVVFDRESYKVSSKRLYDIQKFIDDNYVDESLLRYSEFSRRQQWVVEKKELRRSLKEIDAISSACLEEAAFLEPELEETFSRMLLRLIDEKGMTDPEAYKRANVTRQHFSKIRNKADYRPTKETAVAFAVALRLNLKDSISLLNSAGLTLSKSILFDVIVEYHIKKRIYDIHQINQVLFAYDQPLMGA